MSDIVEALLIILLWSFIVRNLVMSAKYSGRKFRESWTDWKEERRIIE